eukprot:g870.t1
MGTVTEYEPATAVRPSVHCIHFDDGTRSWHPLGSTKHVLMAGSGALGIFRAAGASAAAASAAAASAAAASGAAGAADSSPLPNPSSPSLAHLLGRRRRKASSGKGRSLGSRLDFRSVFRSRKKDKDKAKNRRHTAKTAQFRAPLEALLAERVEGYARHIPRVLVTLRKELRVTGGLETLGIFRIAPERALRDQCYDRLNHCKVEGLGTLPPDQFFDRCRPGNGVNLLASPHVAASLIKVWLRELPAKLLDDADPREITRLAENASAVELAERLQGGHTSDGATPALLEEPACSVLNFILDIACEVVTNEAVTRMNAENMAIVLSPNLASEMLLGSAMVMQWMRVVREFTIIAIEARLLQRARSSSAATQYLNLATDPSLQPAVGQDAVAQFDFAGKSAGDLSFKEGDRIRVVKLHGDGWAEGFVCSEEYEWTSGFSGPENRAINISQGDTLHITWNSPKHNIYQLADEAAFEACTGSGTGANRTGQSLLYPPEEDNGADGAASGSYNIPAPAVGETMYLACLVSFHCFGGQKLALTGIAAAAGASPTGGCATTLYGCCPDQATAKKDAYDDCSDPKLAGFNADELAIRSNATFTVDYIMPREQTTYVDFGFNLPAEMLQGVHLVFGEAIVHRTANLHHFVITGCTSPFTEEEHGRALPGGKPEHCQFPLSGGLSGWAPGATLFDMPKDTGVPVGGSFAGAFVAFNIEVHYTDAHLIENEADRVAHDGILLHYLQPGHRRPNVLMGKNLIGMGQSDAFSIPPGRKRFYAARECEVTQIHGRTSANLISTYHHAHLIGREMYLWLEKANDNGTARIDLASQTHWDFNRQELFPLADGTTLEAGDTLRSACVWNSEGRTDDTKIGLSTYDEMCFNSVYSKHETDWFESLDAAGKFQGAFSCEGHLWTGDLADGEDLVGKILDTSVPASRVLPLPATGDTGGATGECTFTATNVWMVDDVYNQGNPHCSACAYPAAAADGTTAACAEVKAFAGDALLSSIGRIEFRHLCDDEGWFFADAVTSDGNTAFQMMYACGSDPTSDSHMKIYSRYDGFAYQRYPGDLSCGGGGTGSNELRDVYAVADGLCYEVERRAGRGGGCKKHTVDFVYNSGDSGDTLEIVDRIAADLAVVGITVNKKPLEKAAKNTAMQTGNFNLVFSEGWGNPYDPQSYLMSWNSNNEPHHMVLDGLEGNLSPANFKARLGAILGESNQATRANLYNGLLNDIHQAYIHIPLYGEVMPSVVNKRLSGYQPGYQQFDYPIWNVKAESGSQTVTVSPGSQTSLFSSVGPMEAHGYRPNEFWANNWVYEGLTSFDPTETGTEGIKPSLATSWVVTTDANNIETITFTLRTGVKFHDGADFNCAVAKLNFDHVFAQGLVGPGWHGWYGLPMAVKSISCTADGKLVLVANKPYYPLLQELTYIRPSRMMSPNSFQNGLATDPITHNSCPAKWGNVTCYKQDNICGTATVTDASTCMPPCSQAVQCKGMKGNPVGTGPFKYESRVLNAAGATAEDRAKDNLVSFKRNTDYWGTVPAIDVNVVRYDTAAEVDAALKAQTLDAVLGAGVLSSTQINALAADARFDVRFTNAIQNSVVILNIDNLDLRKTIVHAVNKQTIIDDVKGGFMQSVYQLFPLSSPYCNHQFTPVFGYDLEKAKLINCPLVPAATSASDSYNQCLTSNTCLKPGTDFSTIVGNPIHNDPTKAAEILQLYYDAGTDYVDTLTIS